MKHSLDRLFRLRRLLEDVSRLELEVRLQELAQVESSLDHLEKNKRISRYKSFEGFTRAENSVWVEAETMSEMAAWQSDMLSPVHEKKLVEVDTAKAEFLERRKESRQVESVIEAQSAEKAAARSRREQRALDDWFGQRSSRMAIKSDPST